MINLSEFESISPYTDEEAVEALSKVAENPVVAEVSQYFFPEESPDFLKNLLLNVKSIDDFQIMVMSRVIDWVIDHTARNFSYDGISNIDKSKGKFLALSNHRDIILDPAITQLVLYRNDIPMTEIAVGDNLITNKFIEYLIRSNRMIKVVRGISARELYLSSQLLSRYIRLNITGQQSSIWLAQRQGRTKDGLDMTEQGLLKMLDMSGSSDFCRNFEETQLRLHMRVDGGDKKGVTNDFSLKGGRVTLAKLDQDVDGNYRMLIAPGTAIDTEPFIRGNPLTIRFDDPVPKLIDTILKKGFEHHYAVIHADVKKELLLLCEWMKIEPVTI